MSDQLPDNLEIKQEADKYIMDYADTLENFFDTNLAPLPNWDIEDPKVIEKVAFLLNDLIIVLQEMEINHPISPEARQLVYLDYNEKRKGIRRLVTLELAFQQLYISDTGTLESNRQSSLKYQEEFDSLSQSLEGNDTYKSLLKKITDFHNKHTLPSLAKAFES